MCAAGAPSGVVTFLFTDIEGSTRRWETDADAMRVALAAHDDVLHSAVEDNGGWLFKHTGDGVCAAFASPRSAVDAAVAAQRALELPVRIGIATGEAELRGEDYFGPALNRAARVMAAGHGGQILLADSTANLLSGIALIDLGPQRLRGLPGPVGVYQVGSEGLRREFPSLLAMELTPGNLRPHVSVLIGRATELSVIAAALRAHRLVTLTGVGGVGKTRLAAETAGRLSNEFLDGVWLFELGSLMDPAAVPDAVAAVLCITQQPGKTLTESIASAQEGRNRLLVFDNCEHVLNATADLIETILGQSATVKVLTTSREGLGIADEQLWPVPSLDVAAGAESPAVALFNERARNVAQHFSTPTADEAAAVVEICSRLDGIPLAIELAASRMASMTATEVRDRLDQRFRLLVGSRRSLERHQTLRHAVAWSYDLLDEEERSMLEHCSAFLGGFDLESACAVSGSDIERPDEYTVLNLLDALVRKSLMVADPSSGRTRYSMLETIRQFAEEQLVDHGAAANVHMLHARHFAAMESEILALWDSARQREAYRWFTVELANLRTAFRCAADHGDLDSAAAIATYTFYLGGGVESYEPIAWAEELIEAAAAADHPRLGALYVMASQCWMLGRIEDAVRYSDAGEVAIADGREEIPFGNEGALGAAHAYVGQPERWVEWCRDQLARNRDTHTLTQTCLVLALTVAGSIDEAMTAAGGLVAAAEATGNPYALSFALFVHGLAFQDADPRGALDTLRRGLVTAQYSGNRFNETQMAVGLSRLEAECGNPLGALDYFVLAIRNYHHAGNAANLRVAQAELAAVFDQLGRYEPAATIAGFARSPVAPAQPQFTAAIAHLREVLGVKVYESLSHTGELMTTSAAAAYAYEQIEQARAEMSDHG
jgi:predicted ATPase